MRNIRAKRVQQWFVHVYVYAIWMGGAGGFGMGCQWLAGLVFRVCLYTIWMGGAGGGGWGWVANG